METSFVSKFFLDGGQNNLKIILKSYCISSHANSKFTKSDPLACPKISNFQCFSVQLSI